jgi:hypothetical protein
LFLGGGFLGLDGGWWCFGLEGIIGELMECDGLNAEIVWDGITRLGGVGQWSWQLMGM